MNSKLKYFYKNTNIYINDINKYIIIFIKEQYNFLYNNFPSS